MPLSATNGHDELAAHATLDRELRLAANLFRRDKVNPKQVVGLRPVDSSSVLARVVMVSNSMFEIFRHKLMPKYST